jgi:dTDP-4-amino-4,6-dideoxygalactose transaminase
MISVFGSMIGSEEIEAVASCMKSQWIGFGKNVDVFERKFAEKICLRTFAMLDSGSNALYMAVKLLDLPQGSEIIIPSYTWVSCAQVVMLCGHVPVFCDVDIRTMNVRSKDILPHITRKTGAIMVVHYAGLAVDMEPIIALGLPIIEDAAHAVCSSYRGQPCGAITEVGIYSFDSVKNLTAGEGGGITARDPAWIERAKVLRYCGIGKSGFDSAVSDSGKNARWWEYNIQEPFIKMLPTNIAASIATIQLERLDTLQARRKKIWETYQRELETVAGVCTPTEAPLGDMHSYFTYCIRVPRRNDLAHYLLDHGIYSTLRYHPLHLNPLYHQTGKRLPNSERLNEDALNIPIHPRLSDKELGFIVDRIKSFYA